MKIDVLDHGYVRFVEAWGHGDAGMDLMRQAVTVSHDNECGIIEAARQSTQGSFRGWLPATCDCNSADCDVGIHTPNCASRKSPGDANLLRYLYEHNHATPFEFAGMVIEVQAPIFVFREWHRHRTQSYNEMSARYEELPDLYYIPNRENLIERILNGQKVTNRQASGKPWDRPANMTEESWAGHIADDYIAHLRRVYNDFQCGYVTDIQDGIPKELARLGMPLGHYSRMRASANLRNWLAFLTLRTDLAAQWEIRQFAVAVGKIIHEKFPRTFFEWAKEVTK